MFKAGLALDTETCIHYWDLGTPYDWVVRGVCRKCGAEREFPSDPFEGKEKYGAREPVPKRMKGRVQARAETSTRGEGG